MKNFCQDFFSAKKIKIRYLIIIIFYVMIKSTVYNKYIKIYIFCLINKNSTLGRSIIQYTIHILNNYREKVYLFQYNKTLYYMISYQWYARYMNKTEIIFFFVELLKVNYCTTYFDFNRKIVLFFVYRYMNYETYWLII